MIEDTSNQTPESNDMPAEAPDGSRSPDHAPGSADDASNHEAPDAPAHFRFRTTLSSESDPTPDDGSDSEGIVIEHAEPEPSHQALDSDEDGSGMHIEDSDELDSEPNVQNLEPFSFPADQDAEPEAEAVPEAEMVVLEPTPEIQADDSADFQCVLDTTSEDMTACADESIEERTNEPVDGESTTLSSPITETPIDAPVDTAPARAPFGPLIDGSVIEQLRVEIESSRGDLHEELRSELIRIGERLETAIRSLGQEADSAEQLTACAAELSPLAQFFGVPSLSIIAVRIDELASGVAEQRVGMPDAALTASAAGLTAAMRTESTDPLPFQDAGTFSLPETQADRTPAIEHTDSEPELQHDESDSAESDSSTEDATAIEHPMTIDPPVMIEPPTVFEPPTEIGVETGPTTIDADDIQAMMMGLEGDWGSRPVDLSGGKGELLQAMVAELNECVAQLAPAIGDASDPAGRDDAASQFLEIRDTIDRLNTSYRFKTLEASIRILTTIGNGVTLVPDSIFDEFSIRMSGLVELLEQFVGGLSVAMELTWPTETFESRLSLLATGRALHADLVGWHNGQADRVLELDRVTEGIESPPSPPQDAADPSSSPIVSEAPTTASKRSSGGDAGAVRVSRQTIDGLINTVRQLVLNKNQLVDIADTLRSERQPSETIELLSTQTTELDRLLGELRESVSGTRMQPFERLYERFERYARDTARLNDREAELRLIGGATQIDKFTLDQLVDPITKLLRFAVSHSIENESTRRSIGKPAAGVITIEVKDLGGQLLIRLTDDGIGCETLLASLQNEDESEPSDDLTEILTSGNSTSGLDGLEASLSSVGGKLTIRNAASGGIEASMLVPIDGAVIPAMMVVIGDEQFAIPLANVIEIVRADAKNMSSVGQRAVLRLRETVLGVLDARDALVLPTGYQTGSVAVVIQAGANAAVLLVDRVVGQREIVLEKLDHSTSRGEVFSGATIRSDGGVSLVIDAASLIRSEHTDTIKSHSHRAAAA